MTTGLRLHARYRASKKRLLMALLGLITGVEFLENVMFVFAASHIMGGIGAAPREFAQAQAAYAVGSLLMIVKQQWSVRQFGYRRYLCVALTLFIIGTLGCSQSGSLGSLTLFRFIQGIGGGAFFTSSRVLIPLMFKGPERALAVKYFMYGIFSASCIGPLLAATLVDSGSWHLVFYGALPPALLALLGAWFLLPDAESGVEREPLAIGGLLLFGAAVLCLQLMLSDTRYDVFAHPFRLMLLAGGGLALLIGFLVHQWRHPQPILHLRVLANPVYLTGLGLYFLYYAIKNFSGYLFPIYAERGLGLPLIAVGWLDSFAGVATFVAVYAYIRFSRKLPNKKPMMLAGTLIMAGVCWWYSLMPPGVDTHWLMYGLAFQGLFSVMVVLPVAGLTYSELGDAYFGHGYQGKNLMRQLATSTSSALAAVLLQDRQFAVHDNLAATVHAGNPQIDSWLAQLAEVFRHNGFSDVQALAGAKAELARQVAQQAQLLACQDMYRYLAAFAVFTGLIIAVQRKLR
ncbi:MFS transporter [Jeongeupia naejangsanensis]|uniref:MFS transporter n=1 Tax=Jeongeupia naejangsanensis TaxID=613195 RepID=A0ABS2BJJ8_9NEIS|nr:MFS transporter [Jeongeupia naejangsanensis]MBM3115625.1 MFS transporter [Jeongeupia naejangsanensis]